jgi:hypothetical protein
MARPDWAGAVLELEVENQRHAERIAAATIPAFENSPVAQRGRRC